MAKGLGTFRDQVIVGLTVAQMGNCREWRVAPREYELAQAHLERAHHHVLMPGMTAKKT